MGDSTTGSDQPGAVRSTPPRVLLADDHVGLLTALARLLEPDCEIVGRVSDGLELIDAALSMRPDVIVVDVSMPRLNGLEACRRIKQALPETRVIVLTAADDPVIKEKALAFGASAFVLKYSVANQLLEAIRKSLAPNP